MLLMAVVLLVLLWVNRDTLKANHHFGGASILTHPRIGTCLDFLLLVLLEEVRQS